MLKYLCLHFPSISKLPRKKQSNSASEVVEPELNLFLIPLSMATCLHRLEKPFLCSLPEYHTFHTLAISIWLCLLFSTASTSMARSCKLFCCLLFLGFVDLLASEKMSCPIERCLHFLTHFIGAFQICTVTCKSLQSKVKTTGLDHLGVAVGYLERANLCHFG